MKKLVLPIVISTCMISQMATPHLFAMIIDDDCNSSTSQSLIDSWETISEVCVESTSVESSTSDIAATEVIQEVVTPETSAENTPEVVVPEVTPEVVVPDVVVPEVVVPDVVAPQNNVTTQSTGNNSITAIDNTISAPVVMNAAPAQEIINDSIAVVVPEVTEPNIPTTSANSDEEWIIMDAAPIEEDMHINTSWTRMHNTISISGFTWSGIIANYFTKIIHDDSDSEEVELEVL